MRGPNPTAPFEAALGVYRRVSHTFLNPKRLKALTHKVVSLPALNRVLPMQELSSRGAATLSPFVRRLRRLAQLSPTGPEFILFDAAEAGASSEQPIRMPDYSDLVQARAPLKSAAVQS